MSKLGFLHNACVIIINLGLIWIGACLRFAEREVC